MLLLQFSTSHYCRKARLALGYKQIPYQVENLSPGFHALKLKPLTGTTTVPVLIPQPGQLEAIGDSTRIFHFLETYQPEPPLSLPDPTLNAEVWALEDWLDESIGVATRFIYYDFRAGAGKQIDPSISSQVLIRVVRWQYGITSARVELAIERLKTALVLLKQRWEQGYLVGDRLTAADLAAAALLSPLALIPSYRETHAWLFDRIAEIHRTCGEPLPPRLGEEES
ncbi:MAG TPA: glutathione S-transferase [Trichocoleus sp.]|jgi:glutathione S-transferase